MIKHSKIASNVNFTSNIISIREILKIRKENKNSTQIIWITKRPVITEFEVYNPKAIIMIFLN